MGVNLGEIILFLVLLQTGHAEAARILMRIFAAIIPSAFELAGQMGTHQLHRLLDGIDRIEILARNAIFSFNAEEMHTS